MSLCFIIITILSVLLSLTTAVLVYFLFQNKKKSESSSLQKEKSLEIELQKKEEIIRQYKEKELERFKKVLLLTTQKDKEDLLPDVYDIFSIENNQFNWNTFFCFVDKMYNNFMMRLWKAYPNLSIDQLNFCCMIIAGFNTPEIIRLLKIKGNSVRMKRRAVREKFGITGETDIRQFLLAFSECSSDTPANWVRIVLKNPGERN